MESLSKFLLDDWDWYKMGIFISFILFCLIAANQLPVLPTIPSLFTVMGTFFLSLGEYTNHPRKERVTNTNNGDVLEIKYDREDTIAGWIFIILGVIFLAIAAYRFSILFYFD